MRIKLYKRIVFLAVIFWVLSNTVASTAMQKETLEIDKTAIQIDDMPTVVKVEWEPVTPIIIHPQIIPLLFGPNDYMLYNIHGGWWYDAEKTVDNWDDDLMCWAASCSNALEWTGWGVVTDTANGDLVDTDDMFDNFNHYFFDRGGFMSYGWNWWFDGEDPDPGAGRLEITDSGGGYWPTEDIADYYFEEWNKDEVLVKIDEYLHEGYAVTIGIRPVGGSGGHAITVWGFRFDSSQYSERFDDPDSYYLGLYVTDSDDDKDKTAAAPPPNTLRFYNSTYDETNHRWVLSYGSGAGWYIDAVMALAPPDPDVYGHRPTASFAPVENNIDVAVLLDGSGSSDPDGDVLQYRWDFDDDGFWDTAWSFSSTIYHTWGEEYDGNVLLEVFDGRYKDVHRMAVDISGIRPPVAFKFEPVLRDATYELKFTDISPFKSKDIIAWDWDFGGKETSTEKDPVIRLKDEGTYDVKLTLRYRDGTTKTYTKSIEISDPKANFTWSPDIQIEGEAVQFKDLSSSLSSKISTWLWDFGDGSTSKEQNPKHVYYDDGTYKVTLTVTNGDRSKDSITLSVTVQDLSPVAAYSYSPKPQYVGEPVSFIDLSASSPDNIVSWNWNFGDGTTSNDQNPEHIFKETGVYEVRLTVTDEDGSIDAISYRVVINETPSTEKPSTQHSLQIRIEGNGKTDPAPGVAHTYETDSSVQLSAYPAEGWKFSHWSIGVETKTDNPLHWILKEDTKVTAVFVEEQAVTYSVIIEVQGSGTTDPVPGTYELEEGHQLSVKAIPEEGWEFSGWLVNGESAGDTSTLFADITQDHEIVALFLEEIVEQHEEVTKSSDPLSNLINAIKEFFASLFNIFG